ncbi:MAG: hypothetical protein AB7L71_02505 [Vicinamibacterales bacterium]
MANSQATNWRSAYRLHALDLNVLSVEPPATRHTHWVLGDADLGPMVERVLQDCENARDAGADDQLPHDALEFLGSLPFVGDAPPQTFAAQAVFSLRFSMACGAQSLRALRARSAALAKCRRLVR